MKFFFVIIIFGVLGFTALTQSPNEQAKNTDDLERMVFEAELTKATYVRFEPLLVRFKLSNPTNIALKTFDPIYLQEAKVRIVHKGKAAEYSLSSSITGKPKQISPSIYSSGAATQEEVLLSSMLGEYFPEPGEYELQFVLTRANHSHVKSVGSRPITIHVVEPIETEKDAYDFLKKHEKYASLFAWAYVEKDGLRLLEDFVDRFAGTVYGEFAILNLGLGYQNKSNWSRARTEFEKIKNSQNPVIATEVKRHLSKIEKKLSGGD